VLPLPESPYGTAKYRAECYIGLYKGLHGTSHSVLRLANVYGPRQDPAGDAGVIATFCASALASKQPTIYGDGTQTRDYVYVGDVVAAFLGAADRAEPGTWNIGTAVEVSVLDLVAIIAGIAGRELSPVFTAPRPGELARSVLAVDRPASELGWRAVTPLTDGIRRVYRWIAAGAPDRTGC
jgi:UDP-glucose 4-epimerase